MASEPITFGADLRTRYEKDFGVTGKRDRDRLRYRLRGNISATPADWLEAGARIVSGDPSDAQSPHQTLGGNFGKKLISVDRAYALFRKPQDGENLTRDTWFWAGKNGFPFRSRNEMFWDEDVNPEGVSLRAAYKDIIGEGSRATITGGWFLLDPLDVQFTDMPWIGAGEFLASKPLGSIGLTASAGYFTSNDPAGSNARLEGVERDLLAVDFELGLISRPLTIGGSLCLNTADTPDTGDQAKYHGEDLGLVAGIAYGRLKSERDWLAGLHWARIEKWSVFGRLAQDDWWRFGGSADGQSWTDASNQQGFELRLAYAVHEKANLMLRQYVVTEIVGNRDANRVRLDLNVKF